MHQYLEYVLGDMNINKANFTRTGNNIMESYIKLFSVEMLYMLYSLQGPIIDQENMLKC